MKTNIAASTNPNTEGSSRAAREEEAEAMLVSAENCEISVLERFSNLASKDKRTTKSCTLESVVKPCKEELKEPKQHRWSRTKSRGASQVKGVKRKSLDSPEQQSFETRCHTSNATSERFGEEVEGNGRRLSDNPMKEKGENGDIYGSRSEKRLKLKSSITSGTELYEFGGRGDKEDGKRIDFPSKARKAQTEIRDRRKSSSPTEDKRGVEVTALSDQVKQKSEKQYRRKGNHRHHANLGAANFDRLRMTQSRRERDREHRTNGHSSKELPRVDVRHSTVTVRKGGNHQMLIKDGTLEREDLKCARGNKSRSEEDSRTRRDVPKRSREEVDRVREHEVKPSSARNNSKIFLDDHDVVRGDKRLPTDKTDRFRPGHVKENFQGGRWYKQVISVEARMHYHNSRRHGKDLRHNWKLENGRKSPQHGKNGLTKLRAGRHFQSHRLLTNIDKPRSRKEEDFKAEHDQGHSLANTHKQNTRGIAYGSHECHWKDDQGGHKDDGHRSGTRVKRDNSLPRHQGRTDKDGTKEGFPRQPRETENGPDSARKNPDDRKSGKENIDHSSSGTRGRDQSGNKDIKVVRHGAASQVISKAEEGRSRTRCSRKVIAPSHPDEQDVGGTFDQNGCNREKACIGGKLSESRPQESRTMDNTNKSQVLEAAKSNVQEGPGGTIEGPKEVVVKADPGPNMARDDMLHYSTSNPSIPEKRKRKNGVEIPEGREKPRVTTSSHIREEKPSGIQERQESKSTIDKKSKVDCRNEGTAKQKSFSTETVVQERMRTDTRAPRKSEEALQWKRAKFPRKKKEKSNEPSSSRRQVGNVDRYHKHDVSSQEHNHRKRSRDRSHSVSPYKHKHFFSPPKAHGKSTSPRRSERERSSNWERFERERHKTLAAFDSRYRRFGGGTSGLGGYSPRRRRTEAAVKTPSPPPRSPDRKKEKAWDSVPPGMDSSMIAAISAAHQAAVQQALAQLTTVNPLIHPSNMLLSSSGTPAIANRQLPTVPSILPSLQPQILNPAVTAVTLTPATRSLRRLYVGNVPSTVSDGELMKFMNAAMLSANANHLPGTKPCINCSVNVDKNHAFAEFITSEDATAALAFDGVTLHGTTLTLRRPKDFVQPSSGGIESVSAVPDKVSSSVADSPHKVFVGGIPSSFTADKVKEIVTAFGQLKAYHWEVDNRKQPPQCFAFLEYMDRSATRNACTGLNGKRLGTGVLTVVQATPDADSNTATTSAPFYGIPEHAKTLLEPPSCVLEFHNLITAEEVPNLSKEDIEEILEDVRLECARFGNVKSTHMVYRRSHPGVATRKMPRLGKMKGVVAEFSRGENLDYINVPESATKENITKEETQEGLVESMKETSSSPARSQFGISLDVDDKRMLSTDTTEGLSSDHLVEGSEKNNEENCCPTNESSAVDTGIANPARTFELSNEWQANESTSQVDKTIVSEAHELVNLRNQDIGGGLGLIGGSEQEVGVALREWETSHLGKVYVEFSREESACQAAHALHGRLFDGHKVAVHYFPLNLYQKRFHKGLRPRTFQEKQALALAVQEHLTAHIKD